jgi:MerR family transcriptional regulator, repressor of the yfmOP operon
MSEPESTPKPPTGRRSRTGAPAANPASERAPDPATDQASVPVLAEPSLRIGDVARLASTTPRTIRYYEELGLLPRPVGRRSGGHRTYTQSDLDRLREAMRLKDLLGVSLGELKELLAAEEARAAVRAELRRDDVAPERRRKLLEEAQGHLERQLELIEHREAELSKLHDELLATRRKVRRLLREIEVPAHA